MTSEESTSVEIISNQSIYVKHITLEKGSKRQYNRKTKSEDKAKEFMDKLLEEQELTRIKREQDEFDAQKKEAEDQEFIRHIMEGMAQEQLKEQQKQEQQIEMDQFLEKLIPIAVQMKEEAVSKTIMERVKNAMTNTVNFTKIGQKEGEKKQVTSKLIDLTLFENGDLCMIDFDINKKLSIEGTDKIRQNIIGNMLPANVGLAKTAHGVLHAYCNRDGYTLPSNG
ncbi:MAG: hypothetical protein EZS28_006170 [Streblomastix strix]|uniref:Uncharacterized protein n=1 Tax=Streblomastix strix TaxID=222440 RepID=A0A5J4WVC9_9EUKA|nr:MAG: hypothetical protein EZS28_006170 [Streblomastix strix]